MYEPCLCGAPDCPQCYPMGQTIVRCQICGQMIKMCECSEDFPEEISNGIYICKYCGKDITDGKEKEMFRTNIDIN